jgi:Bacterial Ig-like domain
MKVAGCWVGVVIVISACTGGNGGTGDPDAGTLCTPGCAITHRCVEGVCVLDEHIEPTLVSRSPTATDVHVEAPLTFTFSEPLRPLSATSVTVRDEATSSPVTATISLSGDAKTITVVPRVTPPTSVLVDFSGVSDLAANPTPQTPIRYHYPAWLASGTPAKGANAAASDFDVDAEGRAVVAYVDEGTVQVRRHNGTAWEALGGALDTHAQLTHPITLAARGAEIVVVSATADPANPKQVHTARRYTGTSWEVIGGAPVLTEYNTGVAVRLDSTGKPIVAFGRVDDQLTVMRWTGSVWETLTPVAAGEPLSLQKPALVLDAEDRVVIAYPDVGAANEKLITVARWSGTAWEKLGASFAAAEDTAPVLAIDTDGSILLARGTYYTIEFSRWNGSAWSAVEIAQSTTKAIWPEIALAVIPGEGIHIVSKDSQSTSFFVTRRDTSGWTQLPLGVPPAGGEVDLVLGLGGTAGSGPVAGFVNNGAPYVFRLNR